MDNAALKEIMAAQAKKLYELGIVDASFIGLDSTPVAANTKQNNPKSFTKDKFKATPHKLQSFRLAEVYQHILWITSAVLPAKAH